MIAHIDSGNTMAATWLFLVLYLTQSYCSGQLSDQKAVLTNTTYGTVRGVSEVSSKGTVVSFLGIPYAKPPTGARRFQPPEQPEPWTGERDATQLGTMCPQYVDPPGHSFVDEDCLTLNLFTPIVSSVPLPVMFWIHGGSFLRGSGTMFNGTELAHKGVIVVTINYRLDVLGFMSTEDDAAPGNIGLLDQIMALKWVKENIAQFGGDPKEVTIFGESAGAACVSLLLLSPLATGLFRRAIVESGSALSPWAVNYPTSRMLPKLIAKMVGEKVNCKQQSSAEFVACMRAASVFDLLKASADHRASIHLDANFAPVVETYYGVVPDRPLKLLTSGNFSHVDTIRGYNTDEALFLLGPTSGISRDEFKQRIMKFLLPFNLPGVNNLLQSFEDLYIQNVTDNDIIIHQALMAISDYTFIAPTIVETTIASRKAPETKQFLYEFGYRKSVSTAPDWIHAVHADEVPFVFDAFNDPNQWPVSKNHTANDDLVSEQITTIWTNFAKSGSPVNQSWSSLNWSPLTSSQNQLLKIDTVSEVKAISKQPAVGLFRQILQQMENLQEDNIFLDGA